MPDRRIGPAALMRIAPAALLALACLFAAQSAAQESGMPCRLDGLARPAQCGRLEVPENPDAPQGRRIGIHYAVVPAVARGFALEPVFVLAGGPGQAATRLAGKLMRLFDRLNTRRDIVFVDQRGTGGSGALRCQPPGRNETLQQELDSGVATAMLAACLRSYATNDTADLAQYATWIAVRDLDAVRAALGYQGINLWGASYGTRAALEYLRQYPQRVRSIVVDGMAPADMALPASFSVDSDAALGKLISACAKNDACARAYPDLEAALLRLFERVRAGALQVSVAHPLTGRREQVQLTDASLMSLLRAPLYAPPLAAVLPFALAQAERGNFDALVTMTAALTDPLTENLAQGMHFAVICAEDMPRIDQAALAAAQRTRFGTAFIDIYREACREVRTRPVPPEFYETSAADVPVLILSGGADPATPPRHGEAIARRLKRATHLVAPHLGHGISMRGCAPELITRFIRQGHAEGLDGGCLAELPAPLFFRQPGAAGGAQ